MPNEQLEWIANSAEPEKTFRAMVVGWQCAFDSLNATVLSFNQDLFQNNVGNIGKQVALKRMSIASFVEIKQRLDDWYRRMDELAALSPETIQAKKNARNVFRPIEKFTEIRNLTFHYGDPLETGDELVRLYREIENLDIEFLNGILRELVLVGELLKNDALSRTG